MSLPTSVTASNTDYRGTSDLILEDPGTLVTDRTGLVTCTAVIKCRRANWNSSPMNTSGVGGANIGSPHPIFTWIGMEHRELSIQGPWAIAKCDYAGIDSQYEVSGTPPEYELIIGVSESPIATHPKFKTDIGGTATAPTNGANFRNTKTGAMSPGSSNSYFVFENFDQLIGTDLNQFAGVSSYLEPNMTFRKSWKMNHFPEAADTNSVGYVSSPPAPCPNVTSPRNWLNMGINCSHKRGFAYFWTQEWRLSGRRGWNAIIYGS